MPYFFLVLSQLMVAFNVVGSKIVATHISLLMAVFIRFVFATIIIFGLYLLKGDIKRAHFKLQSNQLLMLVIQGLSAGVLFNLFLIMGLQYTSASMAGMIISLLPAVIAIAAVIFFKEHLSVYQKLGIGLALVGLLIINQGSSSSAIANSTKEFLGVLLLLLALVPEATYYLVSKTYDNKQPLLVFSGILNLVNVIGLLPIVLIYNNKYPAHIDMLSIEVLFMTGIASAAFYISWSLGIKHVSAAKAGLFTALSPLLTVIVAALILGETINHYQVLGMFCVICSMILSAKKGAKKIKNTQIC